MFDPSTPSEPDDTGAVEADADDRAVNAADVESDAETGEDDDFNLPPARAALVDRLADYDSLLEVGVGRRPGVAAALASRGVDVTVTDIHEQEVPEGVRFVQDDIVAAAERVQRGEHPGDHYDVDGIYALNVPPELHRPARDVAQAVDADFLFTTLGTDQPAIPVRRETVGRATLFVAETRG